MALYHKDWELPNSRIWLAEIDIKGGRYRSVNTTRKVSVWDIPVDTSLSVNTWLEPN